MDVIITNKSAFLNTGNPQIVNFLRRSLSIARLPGDIFSDGLGKGADIEAAARKGSHHW